MKQDLHNIVQSSIGGDCIFHIEDIQSLWSGYGKIMRYGVSGSSEKTVIIKHVSLPEKLAHPRGWNTDFSHQRKMRSYQIECEWYNQWAQCCTDDCRVPHCFSVYNSENEFCMVLEDLDSSGFSLRREVASMKDIKACLSWLANFHAVFMNESPSELWPIGTYWHLDTRPDELEAMPNSELKELAKAIDDLLNSATYKTIVHGDAKLANFCFSRRDNSVAAVDFQYVGGGCGMKDVAYFIGSCLNESQCEKHEKELLGYYFSILSRSLAEQKPNVDTCAVEQEWRALYPVAWADFHRFLTGWSPGHWKIHDYSEKLTSEVVSRIKESI